MPLQALSQVTEAALLKLPESGMGYQIVESKVGIYVIFNATVALPFSELRSKRFSALDYRTLSGKEVKTQRTEQQRLDLGQDIALVYSTLEIAYVVGGNLGLAYSEVTVTPPTSLFPKGQAASYYRFSAFTRDKRIDPMTGDFLNGTYATTYADIHHVPSGLAAVGRYALPNPAPARYIFQIVTATTPSLLGTAAPNFGQAGGGVEVLFGSGASNSIGTPFAVAVG